MTPVPDALGTLADEPAARRRRPPPGLPLITAALTAHGPARVGVAHPHLVSTRAVGEDGEGAFALTDAAPGAPLGAAVPLRIWPHAEALAITLAIAAAAAALHAAGLIHGGIHVRSVRLAPDGHAWLDDAAIAAAVAHAAGRDDSLLRGLLGSVAPELAHGEPPTPRGDVFSLAALYVTLTTGEPPPGLPPGLPPQLAAHLKASLALVPGKRPADAAAFAAGLRGGAITPA